VRGTDCVAAVNEICEGHKLTDVLRKSGAEFDAERLRKALHIRSNESQI